MSVTSSREAWYAVRTMSRHEKNVAHVIERMGYEAFSPTYIALRKWCDRMKDVELPLFPGYVFGRFDPKQQWRVVDVPGVFDIVHFGHVLAPVDDSEIAALRRVVEAGVSREPADQPHVGDVVEIVAGPLTGLIGPVVYVGDGVRLILSITILRRSVRVHVSPDDIRPLKPVPKGVVPATADAVARVNLRRAGK